jgi:hypothetical protein
MKRCLKVSKSLANSLSAYWAFKKRLWWIRLSDVLSNGPENSCCLLDVLKNNFIEVDESMFQGIENTCELIFCLLGIGKSDRRSRLSDVLSSRMALRTLNLPSEHLKTRLWWRRWSDVSRCRKAMRNHFLHPVHLTKRLGRSRLNHDLSRRMGLRTHNLPSGSLKKRLSWSR